MNSPSVPPQLTVKAILLGLILSVVLAGANAYLGLFAGTETSLQKFELLIIEQLTPLGKLLPADVAHLAVPLRVASYVQLPPKLEHAL